MIFGIYTRRDITLPACAVCIKNPLNKKLHLLFSLVFFFLARARAISPQQAKVCDDIYINSKNTFMDCIQKRVK